MLDILEGYSKTYKKIIHEVLNIVYEHFIIVGSQLEYDEYYGCIFPTHYNDNENREVNGISFITKLHREIKDNFTHGATPLKEYALYNIIKEVELGSEGTFIISDFIHKLLTHQTRNALTEDEINLLLSYETPEDLLDTCFEDIDFLMIPEIYEIYKSSPEIVSNFLHIDLKYYSELLPPDIFDEYKILNYDQNEKTKVFIDVSNEKQFYDLVQKSIYQFKKEIEQQQGSKILNTSLGEAPEKIVQSLFGLFARTFFQQNTDILVTTEPDTGRGKVDFHLSIGNKLQSFIEFKLDSHVNYKKGLQLQLPTYINTVNSNLKHGIFVLICYSKDEFEKSQALYHEAQKLSERYNMQLSFERIDASRTLKSASNINNENELGF